MLDVLKAVKESGRISTHHYLKDEEVPLQMICTSCTKDQYNLGTYKRVVKYPNGLKAPQVRKTTIYVVVKALCLHIEFGMIAGRPRRSCLPIQKMKAGINKIAMVRSDIF